MMESIISKTAQATLREGSRGRVHIQVLSVSKVLSRLTRPPKVDSRLQVLRKRMIDAWMDTFHPDPPEILISNKALQVDNAGLQADGLAAQQQALQQGLQPQPIVLFTPEEGLERWNSRRRVVHRFPVE